MNNTMKQKCPHFISIYCGRNRYVCDVYSKNLIYANEIDETCLMCCYNSGCIDCLNYESCEDRGKYE